MLFAESPAHAPFLVAMHINLLKSKIHRACVTGASLDYEGSLSISSDIAETVGLLAYEKILVSNLQKGERFETYAIPAEKGSGVICLNGAAARLGMAGDKIIIVSTSFVDESEAPSFNPKVVFVNDNNEPVKKKK